MSFANPADRAAAGAVEYTRRLLALLGERDPYAVLEELVPALCELTLGLDAAQLHRPEAPGKWSVLAVVQHLVDTEIVYGFRVRKIVAEDEPALPAYDQDRWAARLRYDDGDLEEDIEALRLMRERSLRLLRSLSDEEFERVGHHAERGRESVRRILHMMAAHDLVHRAQIERVRRAIGRDAG